MEFYDLHMTFSEIFSFDQQLILNKLNTEE